MTRTAIVPMRGGSVRVPDKNIRMLHGKPLYHFVLDALFAATKVTKVVVDSDSQTILDMVAASHPAATLRLRPAELGDGHVSMNDVLDACLQEQTGELFLQTHSTNPFLTPSTIDAAIEALDRAPENDSLFTVTPQQKRFWTPEGKPINHDPAILLPTQELEPMMEENSCLYLFSRQSLTSVNNRIGRKPLLHAMDPLEAVDIDTESDWAVAEALMEART